MLCIHRLSSVAVLALVVDVAAAHPQTYRELLEHCKGVDSSYGCARAIEQFQAGSVNGVYFSRAKGVLTLRTLKKPVRLQDRADDEPESDVRYSYLAFLPEVQLHVVHVQYWEGHTYLVVHQGTGRRQTLVGFPLPSPDRSRVICVSAAGESRYYPNAVEVFDLSGRQFKREYSYKPAPERWSPSEAQWLSPTSVHVSGTCMPDLQGARSCPAQLQLHGGRWSIAHDV